METQYIIVKGSNIDKFTREVQSRLNEGWIPKGGISISPTKLYFYQALILKN